MIGGASSLEPGPSVEGPVGVAGGIAAASPNSDVDIDLLIGRD